MFTAWFIPESHLFYIANFIITFFSSTYVKNHKASVLFRSTIFKLFYRKALS